METAAELAQPAERKEDYMPPKSFSLVHRKDGTVRLLKDGILNVRASFKNVEAICSEYKISSSTVYTYFEIFAAETGYDHSLLLYSPKKSKPKDNSKRQQYFRELQNTVTQPLGEKYVEYFRFNRGNIAIAEHKLSSSIIDELMMGAEILINEIDKILEEV